DRVHHSGASATTPGGGQPLHPIYRREIVEVDDFAFAEEDGVRRVQGAEEGRVTHHFGMVVHRPGFAGAALSQGAQIVHSVVVEQEGVAWHEASRPDVGEPGDASLRVDCESEAVVAGQGPEVFDDLTVGAEGVLRSTEERTGE